jgi:hypothetical protein
MRFIDIKDCFDFSERERVDEEGINTEGEIIRLEKVCCGVK